MRGGAAAIPQHDWARGPSGRILKFRHSDEPVSRAVSVQVGPLDAPLTTSPRTDFDVNPTLARLLGRLSHSRTIEQYGCRCPPIQSPSMSNAAVWSTGAANKFREVARSTEDPTSKLLAEGLTALSEAIRELDARIEQLGKQLG